VDLNLKSPEFTNAFEIVAVIVPGVEIVNVPVFVKVYVDPDIVVTMLPAELMVQVPKLLKVLEF